MADSSNYLRANVQSTSNFVSTVMQYAQLGIVEDIRLCITKRYVNENENELPYQDFTLLKNTPLLLAAVILRLPSIAEPLVIVIDYPGLTMQRDTRAGEVRELVTELTSLPSREIHYGIQPIEPTREMTAELAGRTLLACDYTELTAAATPDFFRRMGA